MKRFAGLSIWWVVCLAAVALLTTGCVGAKHKPGEVFPCDAVASFEQFVAPEAQLAEFSCEFKKWEGKDTLHFKVGVKNVSSQPQRYRVNIFLGNGKAVGGLIPRKTKKGLVKPGQTESFVYPVGGTTREPKSVMLRITTIKG